MAYFVAKPQHIVVWIMPQNWLYSQGTNLIQACLNAVFEFNFELNRNPGTHNILWWRSFGPYYSSKGGKSKPNLMEIFPPTNLVLNWFGISLGKGVKPTLISNLTSW
jgi:hypothetical protein